MMKNNHLKIVLFAFITMSASTMLYSCGNNGMESVVMEDSFPNKPLDSCLTQNEINHYFANRAAHYEDSILATFDLFVENAATPSVGKERIMWEKYDSIALEAYKRINMTGLCGSAALVGLYNFAYDVADQFLTSFAYEGTPHMPIADRWVDEAYIRFMNHGIEDDYDEDDPYNLYFTLEDKKNCLAAEQDAWNQWIAYRTEVSSLLTGKDKELYDMRTNELRRMKLIQLKNQYQWYSIGSKEYKENQLDPQCTDKQLQNYTFFDSVWKEYTEKIYNQR